MDWLFPFQALAVLRPTVAIAAMQASRISDSITAYSTAVAPLSSEKQRRKTLLGLRFMNFSPNAWLMWLKMPLSPSTGACSLELSNHSS